MGETVDHDAKSERERVDSVARAIGLAGKQSILAEALGCRQQTVSKLLTGEIPMTADWALRLSRAVEGRMAPGEFHAGLGGVAVLHPDQVPA